MKEAGKEPSLPKVNLEDSNAVVTLAQALINIQSISGHEQTIANSLSAWLTEQGWKVVLQRVDKADSTGVSSSRCSSSRHSSRLVSCHMPIYCLNNSSVFQVLL